MKNYYFFKILKLFIFTLNILLLFNVSHAATNPKIKYWQKNTHSGANIFNREITPDIYTAAESYNINFFRIAFDKFPTESRDFLIGDADDYTGLNKKDLIRVKKVLNKCSEHNIKVIITMLSLPGSRWKQLNNSKDDLRIWQEDTYLEQAAKFWHDLALELKDQPAIVAYNILNEPHPEKLFSNLNSNDESNQKQITASMDKFNQTIITAIRQVDKETPIIIDASDYASPVAFNYLNPINDEKNILYAFHMYEPFAYTNKVINNGRYSYPGKVRDAITGERLLWNKKNLDKYLAQSISKWQKKNNIDSWQIIAEEFGGDRQSKGIQQYFADLLDIFNKKSWHNAVYSFREDSIGGWVGMNYELGDKKLPTTYWDMTPEEQKKAISKLINPNNPIFKVLKQQWLLK